MRVVAVAGGTSHTYQETSVLPISAVYIQVDYDNVEALSQILKHHNVLTLICTIQITDETASSAQVNLIRASDSSSTVKMFIVSAWGPLPNEESPIAAFQAVSIEQM
ncbi:hypothetical protein NW765_015443 [Fusarium oxysporum]|nr:hypothetical protein FOWG_09141 [Fusarium oxysporum f. sp. lycopersici MN25]KAJ4112373.1 hypothetical protein NW765_015443 [Fusarium oxysporum]KAJ4270742.1 hypothetical protein NW764_014051 [Fusarium oxysporum]